MCHFIHVSPCSSYKRNATPEYSAPTVFGRQDEPHNLRRVFGLQRICNTMTHLAPCRCDLRRSILPAKLHKKCYA